MENDREIEYKTHIKRALLLFPLIKVIDNNAINNFYLLLKIDDKNKKEFVFFVLSSLDFSYMLIKFLNLFFSSSVNLLIIYSIVNLLLNINYTKSLISKSRAFAIL